MLNMGDEEHPEERVELGADGTEDTDSVNNDETNQENKESYDNGEGTSYTLDTETGELEEPVPTSSINSSGKAKYFKCADCDLRFPSTDPYAFGRHMHQNNHHHGGLIDEDGNQLKPPPAPKEKGGYKPSKNIKASIIYQSLKLDSRIQLFYDITKMTFPEYSKTMDDWLFDVVINYYKEHKVDFSLEHLFKDELTVAIH